MALCFYSSSVTITPAQNERGNEARFEWFEYQGRDSVFETPIADDEYLNPIIAGFYPDPSIVRVGRDFYLVNSTFGFYPGLPLFHSTDLVNWTQIGNVIDRPGMIDLNGVHLSSEGLYAPTIEYNNGTFYVINTCVNCGGNFIVTAKDPAGPWSDPVWLTDVGGIDPSLFFEGKRLFIVNNDNPAGEPEYDGHRAIWIRELDPKTFKTISGPKMIVNGGVQPARKPIWIEGPHIYKFGGRYYLSAAEGGTERNHSQVIFRSDDIWGPYLPGAMNPILTQKDLPANRRDPVNSAGHADLFTDIKGNWWAVFLATRTYDGYHFNTGRETFLLPVEWKDGWPMILERGKPVPYVGKLPWKAPNGKESRKTTGNLISIENFSSRELDDYWMFLRIPRTKWWGIDDERLVMQAREDRLGDSTQPSVIARRIQHTNAHAMVEMELGREFIGESGMTAFQNDAFYFAFGIRRSGSKATLRVRHRNGTGDPPRGNVVAETELANSARTNTKILLLISITGPSVSFQYSFDGKKFETLLEDADGTTLSTLNAGGFVGGMIGMYAEAAGK